MKARIMRCIACGAEMILMKVVPDTNMMVAGYEHHTLQCSGCYEVEQRLVFSQRSESRPVEPVAQPVKAQPISQCDEDRAGESLSHIEKENLPGESVSPGKATAPVQAPSAWRRAVEKVRLQQADLNQRAQVAKSDRSVDEDREEAPSQRQARAAKKASAVPCAIGSATGALGARATDAGRAPPAPAEGSGARAEPIDLAQGFDRVWESLVAQTRPAGSDRGASAGEGHGGQAAAS
jgi:hypothetical protein